MSSILTNTSAMVALETLRNINKSLADVNNEISTGMKVSNAKDNAAFWAISTVMSTDVQSFKQISESLSVGSSTVEVARSASEEVTELLQDMKELIVSAQGKEGTSDATRIQTDITELTTQIGSIVNAAQFNGQNLISGTGSVSILSSLDRGSDQTVTASFITVNNIDLGTSAAVAGTTIASGNAGYAAASVATINADGQGSDESSTITLTAGEIAEGDEFTVSVSGNNFVYVAKANETLNDVATELATSISASTDVDVTATATTATDPTSTNVTLAIANDNTYAAAVAASTTITSGNAGYGTVDSATIANSATQTATFAAGTPATGDIFRVTVDGTDYDHTVTAGQTLNDVVNALATTVSAATGLTATAGTAVDPTTTDVTLDVANATGGSVTFAATSLTGATAEDNTTYAITTSSVTGKSAAGGLNALTSIDVTTDASAALTSIETLLTTAIDAAASFGSSQNRIDIQSDFVTSLIDSLNSGIGAIRDADMEAASAKLTALQTQQQLATQSLAIANQGPQTLLALFQ